MTYRELIERLPNDIALMPVSAIAREFADAMEALQENNALLEGTLESRERNIAELQAENERLKAKQVRFINFWRKSAEKTKELQSQVESAFYKKLSEAEAERDALAAKLATPDMFWNADDAEQLHQSIDEFLNDEICNGVCEVGAEFEIQRAVRLPNIKIKVTAIDDESCEAEYEAIDTAKGGQHEDA